MYLCTLTLVPSLLHMIVHTYVCIESLKEELSSAHQKDLQHVHNESAKVLEQTRKALSSELEQREIEVCHEVSVKNICFMMSSFVLSSWSDKHPLLTVWTVT